MNISDLKKGKTKDNKKDAGRSKSKRDKNVSFAMLYCVSRFDFMYFYDILLYVCMNVCVRA